MLVGLGGRAGSELSLAFAEAARSMGSEVRGLPRYLLPWKVIG